MFGFTLPLQVSTGSVGYFRVTTSELDAAKYDLLSLLVTNWGERPMNFYFGCNLREYIFEQIRDDDLKGRVADRISTQVANWMPFLGLKTLNVVFNEDDPTVPGTSMRIYVEYFLTSRPKSLGTLTVELPIASSTTG